ncbi:MAG: YdcF family protein [Ancrocorticia sp.]|nr:YdcF family protein [Ancrocorticia sp.]MCI2001994.1 YdcF family protein [Ancrocorticia sp.]MCI2030057.1 YdcF family protein [Ancrocorticia sp.]
MPTPGLIMLILGILLLIGAVLGFFRERRRLSNALFALIGAGLTLLGLLVVTDNGTGIQPWAVVVLAVLTIGPALGYPILTVFLLTNGAMMVRREQRTLGNLLSLVTGIALVVLPIVLIVMLGSGSRPNVWGTLSTAFAVFVLGLAMYMAFFFLVFLIAAFAYRKAPGDTTAHYVVVLGSGLIGRKVPPLLAARLDKGMEVANKQDPPAILIPSGGRGADEEISEAEGMAGYLEEHGIPPERILKEDRARNTRENLVFSRKLMPAPDTSIVVVTNNYHVFRAAMLTRDLGINATVVGAPTAGYYIPSAFLREFAAVFKEKFVLNSVMIGSYALLITALLVVSFGAH